MEGMINAEDFYTCNECKYYNAFEGICEYLKKEVDYVSDKCELFILCDELKEDKNETNEREVIMFLSSKKENRT